jgi:adenylate cyclase, class 2
MRIEVEQKHRVNDVAAFERQLIERGSTLGEPIVQADEYFAHPCRDYAKTDEALRIRTVGQDSVVTYKGPKLDATTKSRRELELSLAVSATEFAELLAALGFVPVTTVCKSRRSFELEHGDRCVQGALDIVEKVGSYVELELSADQSDFERAKAIIGSLAAELGLGPSERRSYLELLLSAR